jgi:hypothetical protein
MASELFIHKVKSDCQYNSYSVVAHLFKQVLMFDFM